MDKITSLCITVPNRTAGGKDITFRIADYDEEIEGFSLINPSSQNPLNPKTITYRFASEVPIFKLVVRNWWIADLEDAQIPFSEPNEKIKYYEVVFPFTKYNCDVKAELKKGIDLPKGVSENFLLVIGQEDEYYIALICSIYDFTYCDGNYRIEENITDMLHSIHYFMKIYIHPEDVLSTQDFYINISATENAPIRYIYRYSVLEESIEKFYIQSFDDYIPAFISRYLKHSRAEFEFSMSQIKKITSAIEIAFSDEDNINLFFRSVGYTYEDLKDIIPNYRDKLIESLLENGKIDNLIAQQMANSQELKDRYTQVAKVQWLREKDDDRKAIHSDIEVAQKELVRVNGEIKSKQLSLTKLNRQETILEKQITDLDKTRITLLSQIQVKIENFDKDLADRLETYLFIKNIGRIQELNESQSGQVNVVSHTERLFISRAGEISVEKEAYETDSPQDAIDCLAENLQGIGFRPEFVLEIAQTVFAAIALGVPIGLVGYYGAQIALSTSAVIESKPAISVTIPERCCLSDIVELITSADTRTVVIENAFENLTDTLCKIIIRECHKKALFFNITDKEQLKLLSSSLLNHMILIDTEYYYDVSAKFIAPVAVKMNPHFLDVELSPDIIVKQYKSIEGLQHTLSYKKPALLARSNITAAVSAFCKSAPKVNSLVVTEALMMLEINNCQEAVEAVCFIGKENYRKVLEECNLAENE